ncbi:MAG: CHAT domain-containing protein, partial [Terracidiphilus sp.]
VKLYLGFEATPDAATQAPWRDFAIAHFATHAIVDSQRPELSGIVLSTLNRDGVSQNGVLWLTDIYRTPMPVSLVVLSGCRTASGKSIPGEGIASLAQAFLSSGAGGVIGTLWTVDDASAGQMIPWFYQTLLEQHATVAGALREAQLRMLTAHRPPYDWAGYVIEGNWKTRTASSER